ncbi:MAG: T9SS type A sorting domain-containing protein [Bacteroidota bacterium]
MYPSRFLSLPRTVVQYLSMLFLLLAPIKILSAQSTNVPADSLLLWTFDGCDTAQDPSTMTPDLLADGGCLAVSGTHPYNGLDEFSCDERNGGQVVCFPGRTDPFPRDEVFFEGDEETIAFSVTMTPAAGKTGYLSALELDITSNYNDIGSTSEGWAIRVLVGEQEIYRAIDLSVERDFWELNAVDFSSLEAFQFTETTTFRFEILGYGFIENNNLHFDNMVVRGGCIDSTIIFPEGDLALKHLLDNRGKTVFESGELVRFLVRAHNQGEAPVTDVTLINYLPAGWTPAQRSYDYGWVDTTDLNGDPALSLTSDYVIQPGATKTHPLFLVAPTPDLSLTYTIPAEIVQAFDLEEREIQDLDSTPDINPGNDFSVDNVIDNASGDEDDYDFTRLLVLVSENLNQDLAADVLHTGQETPEVYALHEGYPNPFNPVTTLSYQVPEEVHVQLAVYDLQGRMVDLLVDKTVAAGRYEVTFEANHLASGVYFYTMQAGTQQFTRTLLLTK